MVDSMFEVRLKGIIKGFKFFLRVFFMWFLKKFRCIISWWDLKKRICGWLDVIFVFDEVLDKDYIIWIGFLWVGMVM